MTAAQAASAASIDAARFASDVERITNEARLDAAVALFHDDAVADWIIDGVRQHLVGIDEIRHGLTVMTAVWDRHRLRVRKHVECATADTIVLSWRGGFRGAHNQFGTEIWTFRDGSVSRHQMYGYLDVRPHTSVVGAARLLAVAPRIATSFARHHRTGRP